LPSRPLCPLCLCGAFIRLRQAPTPTLPRSTGGGGRCAEKASRPGLHPRHLTTLAARLYAIDQCDRRDRSSPLVSGAGDPRVPGSRSRDGHRGRRGSQKPRGAAASERPRNVGWLQAAGLLFGDWGTSRLYVLGLALFFAGRSSFWLICAMSLLILAVGWAYTQICRIYPDGGGVYTAAKHKSRMLAVVGALLAVRRLHRHRKPERAGCVSLLRIGRDRERADRGRRAAEARIRRR
jgi:hypothetical protein